MGQVASHPPRGSNLSFPRADVRNGYSDPHSLRSWSLQIARCNGNDNPSTLHNTDDDQDGPWEVSSTYRRFNRPIRFSVGGEITSSTSELTSMYYGVHTYVPTYLHMAWLYVVLRMTRRRGLDGYWHHSQSPRGSPCSKFHRGTSI